MSQQEYLCRGKAYLLQSEDGTYAVVSNGGQAIRITPCETIDDVARYIVNSQRIPVRDFPPGFKANDYSGWRPISFYNFEVLSALVTEEEANEVIEKSESPSFLSNVSSKIPALMSILHIGKK